MAEKNPSLLVRAASRFLYGYIRLAYRTNRWSLKDFEELKARLEKGEPTILAFWHGRMAMMPNFAPKPENVYVMISRHRDGELIARTIEHFGLQLIRGSTNRAKTATKGSKNRGGFTALKEALAILENGKSICITPDGPKGPRMRVTSAIAEMAAFTNLPVYPVAFSTTRGKLFQSWDRFLLPLPFGRGFFVCGKPLKVQKKASAQELKKARKAIENRLNNVTMKADKLAGRPAVKPASLSTKSAKDI